MLSVYGIDFKFSAPDAYRVFVTPASDTEGIRTVRLSITLPEKMLPEAVRVRFSLPLRNVFSVYHPLIGQFRNERSVPPQWARKCSSIPSRLPGGIPLLSLFGHDEKNSCTVSLSDAKTPTELSVGVIEETDATEFVLDLFTYPMGKIASYTCDIRIDCRPLPYTAVLADAEEYLFKASGVTPMSTPDCGKHPFYSTWYSYHQNVDEESLVAECKAAKELGMTAVIVDDGWQTDDNHRGYAFCGDWEITKNKFPDIHRFVKRIHEIGMKVMFWFAVPYIGIHATRFDEFRDMILGDPDGDTFCLDPRFPKVREYLIEKYVRAVKDWGLDGLKLDFIDAYGSTPFTDKTDPRMDYEDLFLAVGRLLSDTSDALLAVKPDVMIEYRQAYVGPYVQATGNLFRVGDCPADALVNRVSAIDMRLVMHGTTVHSDMLMWHNGDSVESAARQLLNVFFTVPQISVRTNELPENHRKMISHYLSVWEAHRETLLNKDFLPEGVDGSYSFLTMESETDRVCLDFKKNFYHYKDETPLTYINVTAKDELCLVSERDTVCRICDCIGNCVTEKTLKKGTHFLTVPLSGMMTLT